MKKIEGANPPFIAVAFDVYASNEAARAFADELVDRDGNRYTWSLQPDDSRGWCRLRVNVPDLANHHEVINRVESAAKNQNLRVEFSEFVE
jgi:hypothetical protein